MGKQFDRYLDAMHEVYKALPDDWQLFTEHKMYEQQLPDRLRTWPQGKLSG